MIKYKEMIKNKSLDGFICNCGGFDKDHAEDCPAKKK